MRPLTDKQQFALRAVEKSAVTYKTQRIGWRTFVKYFAWDSEITTQIHSLIRIHRLVRYVKGGRGTVELRRKS